ncbi:hypothetical protein GOP47_0002539 [Adiantum capillus-veneris]|uniref:Uncharacterized protein n=1 Tax=Adiantum capillus-veneris TaxID=13818 RepID=A0A9D4ZR16_ADICA|nr:hypothetical protein GOP47_0002539 [Adiantum capillus-veneris]
MLIFASGVWRLPRFLRKRICLPNIAGCNRGALLLGGQPWSARQKGGSVVAWWHGVERWQISVVWWLRWASSKGVWLPLKPSSSWFGGGWMLARIVFDITLMLL